MAKTTTRKERARRNAKRTALLLGAIAVVFYLATFLWH
jgi:hypothetical protein